MRSPVLLADAVDDAAVDHVDDAVRVLGDDRIMRGRDDRDTGPGERGERVEDIADAYIDVEANGKKTQEMHADGGLSAQLFVAPESMVNTSSGTKIRSS